MIDKTIFRFSFHFPNIFEYILSLFDSYVDFPGLTFPFRSHKRCSISFCFFLFKLPLKVSIIQFSVACRHISIFLLLLLLFLSFRSNLWTIVFSSVLFNSKFVHWHRVWSCVFVSICLIISCIFICDSVIYVFFVCLCLFVSPFVFFFLIRFHFCQ